MRIEGEHDLICDFMQYYSIILDFESLPVTLVAILASGLPPESRTMTRITGRGNITDRELLVGIYDRLNAIQYMLSTAETPPEPLYNKLYVKEPPKEVIAHRSGADFDAAWERMRKQHGDTR